MERKSRLAVSKNTDSPAPTDTSKATRSKAGTPSMATPDNSSVTSNSRPLREARSGERKTAASQSTLLSGGSAGADVGSLRSGQKRTLSQPAPGTEPRDKKPKQEKKKSDESLEATPKSRGAKEEITERPSATGIRQSARIGIKSSLIKTKDENNESASESDSQKVKKLQKSADTGAKPVKNSPATSERKAGLGKTVTDSKNTAEESGSKSTVSVEAELKRLSIDGFSFLDASHLTGRVRSRDDSHSPASSSDRGRSSSQKDNSLKRKSLSKLPKCSSGKEKGSRKDGKVETDGQVKDNSFLSELRRLQTTEGFWSPIALPSDTSRDASPSSASSLDRSFRHSSRPHQKRAEPDDPLTKGNKASGVPKGSKGLVSVVSAGSKPGKTKMAEHRESRGLERQGRKSGLQTTSGDDQKPEKNEPIITAKKSSGHSTSESRDQVKGKRSESVSNSSASASKGVKRVPSEASLSADVKSSGKKAINKESLTTLSLPVGQRGNTERVSESGRLESLSGPEFSIGDLLVSGELKRLNTTSGFWAPTPDIRVVLGQHARRHMSQRASPVKTDSRLLQLRKKTLQNLKKTFKRESLKNSKVKQGIQAGKKLGNVKPTGGKKQVAAQVKDPVQKPAKRKHFYFGAKKKKGRKGIPIHKNKLKPPSLEPQPDDPPASPCLLDDESEMPESLVRTSSQRLQKLREKENVDENRSIPERSRRGREVKGAQESATGGESKMAGGADRKFLAKKEKVSLSSKQCKDKEQAMSDQVELENTDLKSSVSSPNSSVLPCLSKEKGETFEEKEHRDSNMDQSYKEMEFSSKLDSKEMLTWEEGIDDKLTEPPSDKVENVEDASPLLRGEALENLSVKKGFPTRKSKKKQEVASESVSAKPPTMENVTSSGTQDLPPHNSDSGEMNMDIDLNVQIRESGDEKSKNELHGDSRVKLASDAVKNEDVYNQSGNGESLAVPLLEAGKVSCLSDIKLVDKTQALPSSEKMSNAGDAIEAVTDLDPPEAIGGIESSKDVSHSVMKSKKSLVKPATGKLIEMKGMGKGANTSSTFQEKDVLRRVRRRRPAWQRGVLKKAVAVRRKDKPRMSTSVTSKESDAIRSPADTAIVSMQASVGKLDVGKEFAPTGTLHVAACVENEVADSKEKDVERVSCPEKEENLSQENHPQCLHTMKLCSQSGDDGVSLESAAPEVAVVMDTADDASTLNSKQISSPAELCIGSGSSAPALESALVELQQKDNNNGTRGVQEKQTEVTTPLELDSASKEVASGEAPTASRTNLMQNYQRESMPNSGEPAKVQFHSSSEIKRQSDGASVSESTQLVQKKGNELNVEDTQSSSSGPSLGSGGPVVLDAELKLSETNQAVHNDDSEERSTQILSSESIPTGKKLPKIDGIDQEPVRVPTSDEDKAYCLPPLEIGSASGEAVASLSTAIEEAKNVQNAGVNDTPTSEEATVKTPASSEVTLVLGESGAHDVPDVAETKSLQTSSDAGSAPLAKKSPELKKKTKSGKAMLKRLQTNANLANAVLDYKSLITRARRGVLKDTSSFGKHKLVKDASAKIKAQAKAKAMNELRLSIPGQTVVKRPRGRPRKHVAGSVPQLTPAGSKVCTSLPDTPRNHSPPLLSPQNLLASAPEHSGDAVANTEGPSVQEDFVKEGVDDTDFHLYFSAASEDETSPVKEKAKDKEETVVPFSLGSKVKEQGAAALGSEANEKNEVGRKKMKGKRGRPPGLPMTKVDKYFSGAASSSRTQPDKAVLKDVPLTVVPMRKGKDKFLVSKSLQSPLKSPRTARKSLHSPMMSVESVQEPSRKFEFRKKTTRSPLEMLRMKRKQEEARYDMEEEKRQARILHLREKRNARISYDEYGVEEDGLSLFSTKPCAVVLSDFVKKLQLDAMDSPREDISENGSKSPEYNEDQDDADWCADLEDVQEDDEDWVIKDGSASRPHIPRLKLKRVMKKGPASLAKKHKSRSLTSELIPSEQEPLKLVIKTEVTSDVEERLKSSGSSPVVDLTTVETTGFEGSYVDFLKGKHSDDFMGKHKANKRKTYTTLPCSSQSLKKLHSSIWASAASGDVSQVTGIVHEDHQVDESPLGKAGPTIVQQPVQSQSLNTSSLCKSASKNDGPVPSSAAEDDEDEDVLILDLDDTCSAEKVQNDVGTTSSVDDQEKCSENVTGASEMNIMLDSYKGDDSQDPNESSLAKKDSSAKIQGTEMIGQEAMTSDMISEKEKDGLETKIKKNCIEGSKPHESEASKATASAEQSFDAVSSAPSNPLKESSSPTITLQASKGTSGGEEVQSSPQISIVSTHEAVDKPGPALSKGEGPCQDMAHTSGGVSVLDSVERLEKNLSDLSQTLSSKTQSATTEESLTSGISPVQSSLHSSDHDKEDDETEGIGKLKIILPSDRVPSGKYICKRCNFSTGFKLTIESHIYSHFPGVQFRCAYCQSEFSSMAATCSHLKNTHTSCESKLYISRHIEESNFYIREDGIISEENAKTIASQISSGTTGGSSPPVIISVLVSGARGGRSTMASRRFVCTHCGFSTNKREDADQHVSDLHSSHSIYACILCNESVYYSEAEIKQHCLTVHPSRHRPYRKLPDFYDADQLGMMDKAGSLEEHSNIFDRVSSMFPAEDAEVEAGSIDHRQKAKDYLYLQEGWKEKRSAEADSTTAADFIEDSVADAKDSDVVESSELTMNSELVPPPMGRGATSDESVTKTTAGSCLNDGVITSSATVVDQELTSPQRPAVSKKATSQESPEKLQAASVKASEAEGMELSGEETKTPSAVDQNDECKKKETAPSTGHPGVEEGMTEDGLDGKTKSDAQDGTKNVNSTDVDKSVVPTLDKSVTAETYQAETDEGENETGLKIVQVVSLRGLGEFSPVSGPADAEIEDPESTVENSAQNLCINSIGSISESPLQGVSSITECVQAPPSDVPTSALPSEASTAANTLPSVSESESELSSIPQSGQKSHDQDLSMEAGSETVGNSISTARSSSSQPPPPPSPPQSSSAQSVSTATSTPTSVTSTSSSSQSQPSTASPIGGLPLSYRCNACKVHTPYLLMMVKHLKAKHPNIRCFACPYCKAMYSFNSQKQLRHHVKNQHPEKMDKNEISLSEEAKKFVEAMVLPNGPECIRVGNRIVLEEDIHTCTYCSLKMTSLTSVYEHLNEKHTDLFEFVCPVCQSYKNKSLEKVSDHCRRAHKSDLDTDKVHVSVPKNLFTVLTCISKNAKYIEKSLTSSSEEKAASSSSTTTAAAAAAVTTTSLSSSSTSSSVEKGGAGEPKTVSAPVQTTATVMATAVTSAITAPVVLSSHTAVASAISPAVLPCHPITEAIPSGQQPSASPQSAPVVSLISQTPLIAIPIMAGQPGTPPRIAFSSALFDTSSLTIPPQVTFKPGSKPVAVIQSNGASLQHLQQALTQQQTTVQKTTASSSPSSSSRNLPVLNVPTIRPRSSSMSGAGASQKKPTASPAPGFSGSSISEPNAVAHRPSFTVVSSASSAIPQGAAIHSGLALTSATPANLSNQLSRPSSTEVSAMSLDNLPEEEPTPDAFKIFNLRPTTQSAPPSQTSAAVSPSVFPPVSAAQLGAGYIQGPVAGFPAGMVISPNLLPRPFPYPQPQTSVPSMMAPVAAPSSSAQQRATQRSMLMASFQQKQQIDHQQQMKRQRQMKHQTMEAQRRRALLQQASSLAPQRHQQRRDDPQAHKQQRQHQQQPLAIQPAHQQQPSISGQVYQPGGHSTHRVFSPPFLSASASPSSSLSHPSGLAPSSSGSTQGKKGVHKRSSSTYQCPYCPKVVPLRALDVATHIHQQHPGQPVTFKKFM